MARRGFRIHSSAVFDPFSYQEMLAPLMQAQTAYDQMQDNMLVLGEEANTYKQLIDTDPEASKTLQEYNNTLESMANQLSTQGLKAVNRNSLLNLRRRYNRDVKPINDAAKTLAGLQDMYRNAYAKDQTLMKGAMPTISELVANPGAMPHMVSGNSLYNQGAQAAKAASTRKQDFKARINGIVRGYIDTVDTYGYNSAEAAQFLDAASRQPELQAIVNQIYGANRVGNLDNPGQGMQWIIRGVFDGLTYDQKTDLKYDQYAAEMRAAARAAQTSGAGSSGGSGHVDKFNLYNMKDMTQAGKYIAQHHDYFVQKADGTWGLSDVGKERFKNEQAAISQRMPAAGFQGTGITHRNKSGFTTELEKVYGKEIKTEQDYLNAWSQYYDMYGRDTYDATKQTAYRYIPQGDDTDILKRLYKTSSPDGKIYTVEYNSDSNKFVNTNDSISVKDIDTIGDIEMSNAGIVVNVGLKDGNNVQVKMPISSSRLSNLERSTLPHIDNTRNAIISELYKQEEQTGIPYSRYASNPEDALALAAQYDPQMEQWLSYMLSSYEGSIQAAYDDLANIYRATDAQVSKR